MARKRTSKTPKRQERRLTVRSVRRDPPDIGKLSKALIALAMAEAEREAVAQEQVPGHILAEPAPDPATADPAAPSGEEIGGPADA
jgi:hypothetical protein